MCSGRLLMPVWRLPVRREAELGGDHDVAAERGEGLADEFFVDERAVRHGGVEERDAALHGGPDDRDAVAAVGGGAEAAADAHAAEPIADTSGPLLPSVRLSTVAPRFCFELRT